MAKIIPSNAQVSNHCRKSVAFDGAAGNGAVGVVNLFTITGQVIILALIPYCSESLISAGGGTLVLGDATTSNCFILSSTATAIDAGFWWIDATPTAQDRTLPTGLKDNMETALATPIRLTVATGDITDGTLVFDCFWLPLSADGSVVPV